ncbi:MAG: hypothetical protein SXV54_22765 [Chloroflexota bacterium]|nr:hypothetical protein [Chloroflexota bacterium]
MRRIVQTWWPLAASWMLMAVEGPVMSAVVARLADPEIHLAAWGGVVWPLLLIIESPIIMLLSASTALSKDWDSYLRLRRFMMRAGAILTALHVLVAFTPLYYIVVVDIIGAPVEIIEPARVGLMIMPLWTWAIAYRRFNQGVLIRFDHSRAVGLGTLVRLVADGLVLATGYLVGTIPGIVVATSAIATGVVSEAVYAGLRVRPVLRDQLKQAPPVEQPLTLRTFIKFYVPLATTSLLNMLVQPIISAALSRMPNALESLAVWSVVSGFVFLLRSTSYAYNEVVIALLDEPRSARNLRRFAISLAALTTAALLIVAATPLATFWFGQVSALSPRLVALAGLGLWIALPIPGLNALQSWYQGTVVHSRRTRFITEAVAIFLLVDSAILWAGVVWGRVAGLYVGLVASGAGMLTQTAWLWWRSRPARHVLLTRDQVPSAE